MPGSCTHRRAAGHFFPFESTFALCEMRQNLGQRHGIQNPLSRNAAFAGHFHAPAHVIELADGMSVRIDAENAAVIQRLLMPTPVKIKTPGMSVDFNGNAVFPARPKDPVDVDFVTGAAFLGFRSRRRPWCGNAGYRAGPYPYEPRQIMLQSLFDFIAALQS